MFGVGVELAARNEVCSYSHKHANVLICCLHVFCNENHSQIACKAVTALIQYFFLSAFCWMMCEGVMLYLMLVVVFSTLKTKWWFFVLLGWGIILFIHCM